MILYQNSPWFELVKSGQKIYEGRRHTVQIDLINIGDTIEVKHYIHQDKESYFIKILEKIYFKTFEEALTNLDINKILPIENITIEKGIEIYKQYVSINTQLKDG